MFLQQTATPVTFIYVTDRERAFHFYGETLSLALGRADAFGEFWNLGGALMRMMMTPDHKPAAHAVLGWHVEDLVSAVTALRDKGIEFGTFETLNQDSLGIVTAADGTTKVAFFADPDGNLLMLSQA